MRLYHYITYAKHINKPSRYPRTSTALSPVLHPQKPQFNPSGILLHTDVWPPGASCGTVLAAHGNLICTKMALYSLASFLPIGPTGSRGFGNTNSCQGADSGSWSWLFLVLRHFSVPEPSSAGSWEGQKWGHDLDTRRLVTLTPGCCSTHTTVSLYTTGDTTAVLEKHWECSVAIGSFS